MFLQHLSWGFTLSSTIQMLLVPAVKINATSALLSLSCTSGLSQKTMIHVILSFVSAMVAQSWILKYSLAYSHKSYCGPVPCVYVGYWISVVASSSYVLTKIVMILQFSLLAATCSIQSLQSPQHQTGNNPKV